MSTIGLIRVRSLPIKACICLTIKDTDSKNVFLS